MLSFPQLFMDGPRYQKFRIPPDFELAELHARCCRVFKPTHNPKQKCACCNQIQGQSPISICSRVSSLRSIGEEIPLFFKFINVMAFLALFVIFWQAGRVQLDDSCQEVYYEEKIREYDVKLLLGFKCSNEGYFMVEMIGYAVWILGIKIYLKKKKYDFKSFDFDIEKRSVKLTNLPRSASKAQIQALFCQFSIQEVVFSYRIREYYECLSTITKIKKEITYLNQSQRNSNLRDRLNQRMAAKLSTLSHIKKRLENKNNRLSTAFVVFHQIQHQKRVLKDHSHCLGMKLFLKLFPGCSKSSIRGHHVTVEEAPSPDDINWLNLENPYIETKLVRFASSFACSVILIFGIALEAVMLQNEEIGNFLSDIVSPMTVFLVNLLIVNFLEWTTEKIEKRETNTMAKKSLLRKLTIFMFINISISPFFIYLYKRVNHQISGTQLIQTISLTVLLIALANLFKPFLTCLSLQRFLAWIKCLKEKAKDQSDLNQLEANKMFEPIEFPIQIFYSLIHASLMMSFFYLGCFQILFLIELPSLILTYFISKWMLLRVCKKPQGMSLQMNNLAQSLLRFFLPLYWVGRNSISYLTLSEQDLSGFSFIGWTFKEKPYSIISVCIMALMLVSEPMVRRIASRLAKAYPVVSEYLIEYNSERTYCEANLFYQLYEQEPGLKEMAEEGRSLDFVQKA